MKKFTKLLVTALLIGVLSITGLSLAGCVSSPNLVIGETIYGKTLLSVSIKGTDTAKITVPEGVEYIATNAFLPSCLSLSEIKLPKSLKRIGKQAFLGCINLQKVTLPKKNKLAVVGDGAFANCYSLNKMTIANPVEFGNDVFENCSNLTLEFTSENLSKLTAYFDVNAIIAPATKLEEYKKLYSQNAEAIYGNDKIIDDDYLSVDGTTLDKYIGHQFDITIPQAFTKIGEEAFSSTYIEKITLPNTITELGENPFAYLPNIKEITLSSNLQTIPEGCFSFQSKLSVVNIPLNSKLTKIEDNAFSNCLSLTGDINLSSVTYIGTAAFNNCTGLTGNINLPSVTHIGKAAFYNCTAINAFTFSNNLTGIGDSAFANCTSVTTMTLPKSVKSVGSSICENWTDAQSINAPNNSVFSSYAWRKSCLAKITYYDI